MKNGLMPIDVSSSAQSEYESAKKQKAAMPSDRFEPKEFSPVSSAYISVGVPLGGGVVDTL